HQGFANVITAGAGPGGGANMHCQLLVMAETSEQGNGDHGSLAPAPAGSRPGVAPRRLGYEVLKRGIEGIRLLQRAIDMGVAQHRAARRHAFAVTSGMPGIVLHCTSPPAFVTWPARSAANAAGCSTIGRCPAPCISRYSAPGMAAASASTMAGGVAPSRAPA